MLASREKMEKLEQAEDPDCIQLFIKAWHLSAQGLKLLGRALQKHWSRTVCAMPAHLVLLAQLLKEGGANGTWAHNAQRQGERGQVEAPMHGA